MEYKKEYERWLNRGACEVINDESIIEDCFYRQLDFGTGGIRAIMGPGPNRLNVYTIRKNTEGFARFIESKGIEAKKKGVVIAYDNRRNSKIFSEEAARVLATHEIHVYLFEKLTATPELSFAIRYLQAQGGINITASHNPAEYNGYKTYDEYGCQSVLRDTNLIIDYIRGVDDVLEVKVDENKNNNIEYIGDSIDEEYFKQLETVQEREQLKKNIRIVYTPLHGTGNIPVRVMLRRLGYYFEVVEEQSTPDPCFINTKSPNPENRIAYEMAIEKAKQIDADIIFATDPDCDRMGIVVKHRSEYRYLTGNQIGAILLEYLLSSKKEKGTLPENGIIFDTIVTSSLGRMVAQKYGIEVESTLTGFKFIGDKITEYDGKKEFLFGYEESCGYLIKNFTREKDGVQAIILAAEAANYYRCLGKTFIDVLDELYEEYGRVEDTQECVTHKGINGKKEIERIVNEYRYADIEEIEGRKIIAKEDYIQGLRYESDKKIKLNLPKSNVIKLVLDDDSWIAIRPSGNEPKIKYYRDMRER